MIDATGDLPIAPLPQPSLWNELRAWPARRWWFALGTAITTALLMGLATDVIPNPMFGRDVPPTPWSWPVLVVTSILAGLVAATYVARIDNGVDDDVVVPTDKSTALGTVGAFAAFFAIGCPVCNKLALLALGYSGALQYFAPVQPFLAAASIVLLAAAFVFRVKKERSCTARREISVQH